MNEVSAGEMIDLPIDRATRSILIVEDEPNMLESMEEQLSEEGFEITRARASDQAGPLVQSRDFAAVVIGLRKPDPDGLTLMQGIRALRPSLPIVAMNFEGSTRSAVDAMRAGAFDSVPWPDATRPGQDAHTHELARVLERTLRHRALEEENQLLRTAVERTAAFGDLAGKSVAMNRVYESIRKLASDPHPVLLSGENGTGKELIARTLHLSGGRKGKAFIAVDCTARPEDQLEKELFGPLLDVLPGAPTGGGLESAQGGTLFLDEVGALPISLQDKLLGVLQDREVHSLGAPQADGIAVRIVASSSRSLDGSVRDGRFRQALFDYLNANGIEIPPLRARSEDIPILADVFLRRHTGSERHRLSEAAQRKLTAYHWSGNGRELERCIERALAISASDEIRSADILLSSEPAASEPAATEAGDGASEEAMREQLIQLALRRGTSAHALTEAYIDAALAAANGRKSLAARMVGMNRRTLYRREERLSRQAELMKQSQLEQAGMQPAEDAARRV